MTHPLADEILDQFFESRLLGELRSGNGICSVADAIDGLYQQGYVGCFEAPEVPVWARRIADYDRDQFRSESPGPITFSEVFDSIEVNDNQRLFAHINEAWDAWQRDGVGQRQPFTIYQNYGDCVDAQNIESIMQCLGVRANDPQYAEVFRFLVAFLAYAERGYCRHGWTLSAVCRANNQIGFCPAIQFQGQELAPGLIAPDTGLDFDDENDSEDTVARTWCRSGVPGWLKEWTSKHFAFGEGAHTYMDNARDVEAVIRVFAGKGGIQTGSNITGNGGAFRTKRIGGHAQFIFLCAYDDETISFYRRLNRSIGPQNPVLAVGQTWGANWSGATPAGQIPPHWGRMPEGVWVIDFDTFARNMSSYAHAILPRMKGIPRGDDPPEPPSDEIQLVGSLFTDSGEAIRGVTTAICGDQRQKFIVEKNPVDGTYRYVRRAE